MIANFFQSLERHRVEYLLISGQATVLYGAATFSEDIDLWINPTGKNRDSFLLALRDCQARYYKLTPPLTLELLERGHGFHFFLPGDGADESFLEGTWAGRHVPARLPKLWQRRVGWRLNGDRF